MILSVSSRARDKAFWLIERNAFIVGKFVIVTIHIFVNGVKYLNMADVTDVLM